MFEYVFWQGMISPHMTALANALAANGAQVTYVAGQSITEIRAKLGWSIPTLTGVNLVVVENEAAAVRLVLEFGNEVVHLTQGVRRNGYIRSVRNALIQQKARWCAMMETVDERGLIGWIKRLDYSLVLSRSEVRPDCILGIGSNTTEWIAARGFPRDRIFPFTYFLEPPQGDMSDDSQTDRPVRIGFAGSLQMHKRLDLLIKALGECPTNYHLSIVGSGPLEHKYKKLANKHLLQSKVTWHGAIPIAATRREIGSWDCLVLPSDYDGWGTVVSEALMAGTPAICSDACGAALIVRLSGVGGVFPSTSVSGLRSLLHQTIRTGPIDSKTRRTIARWAMNLSAFNGACYLNDLMNAVYCGGPVQEPPWNNNRFYSCTQ